MPFNPPKEFDFAQPAAWTDWLQRFQRYRVASKLNKEEGDIQVCTVIYCMGPQAEKILTSFNLSPEEMKDFKVVTDKFTNYFVPQVNIIHERARFHARAQKAGENIEAYIRSLYELSEHTDFANREEAIRDRLVLGVLDKELSEKLQLTVDLTLVKAQEIARQWEQVKSQLSEQRQTEQATAVSAVTHRTGDGQKHVAKGGQTQRGYKPKFNKGDHPNRSRCANCGYVHKRKTCPAQGKTCHRCKKKNHFQSVCRSKVVNLVSDTSDTYSQYTDTEPKTFKQGSKPDNVLFVGSMGVEESEPPWRETFTLLNRTVSFKVDTGADVSVISESLYKTLKPRPELSRSNAVLHSPGGRVDSLGQFLVHTMRNGRKVSFRVFVVRNETDSLLSRDVAVRLNLVKRVDATEMKNKAFGPIGPPVKTEPVKIRLREGAEPYSITVPRRIPIPLLPKVEAELKRMEDSGVIEKVTTPTDWCSPMVPVLKRNNEVRICVDLKNLNRAVKRERYTLPTFDDVAHKLAGSKVYSKLDVSSGFWQIPLDPESQPYTTFMTPFGRFMFKRLPFGINLAPEVFQRIMENILRDCEGVVCYMDDVLVYAASDEEHDRRLDCVLNRIVEAGLKLNEEKCVFKTNSIEFLGHTISAEGIRPDPAKIRAIADMSEPQNVADLRRFLGMVNFLGRYVHNLADVLRPLNDLLCNDVHWTWGAQQTEAFRKVKQLLTDSQTLAFFDPGKETVVCADASSYGLGGVLYQVTDSVLRPVAFCSRSLTDAEKRYAQIEKETLAVVHACEKFERYLVGLPQFRVLTDHRPLVPLINKKDLLDTPLRCQRMLMRLMRYNLIAEYTPGKTLVVADTLSRAPLSDKTTTMEDDVTVYVDSVRTSWSVSDQKLDRLAQATQNDIQLKTVLEYVRFGWPQYKADCKFAAREYFPLKDEFSEYNGLVIRGGRIVIPWSEREDVLDRIHEGHLGIQKCRERANQSVWWPGMSIAIADRVSSCKHCLENKPTQQKETLRQTEWPERPFQKVGVDLFEMSGVHYLVSMDYYSKYIDIHRLSNNTSSHSVIDKLKIVFATHGIPETVVSDNGPQFTSATFNQFSQDWQFNHITSSPGYPQANGEAENGVKIAKSILRQTDWHTALLVYRATPIPSLGVSPGELAFGRRLRTNLPTLPSNYMPKSVDSEKARARNAKYQQYQKQYYDQRARDLPVLSPGEKVLIKDDSEAGWKRPGNVIRQCAPRSYLVDTPQGELRRNRRHLRPQRSGDETPVRGRSPPSQGPVNVKQLRPEPAVPLPTASQPVVPAAMVPPPAVVPPMVPPPTASLPVASSPAEPPPLPSYDLRSKRGYTASRPLRFQDV